MDMGLRPVGGTLDRINTALGYCPSNCRWADRKCQARNKRTNRFLTYEGITQCLQDWSRETGISTSAIRYRIDQAGWSIEKALTTPTHSTKNHHCGTTYDFYLSGGMRGYPELNYPTFNIIAKKLREMGHTVFNPAEYDVDKTFAECITRDLLAIIHECDGILFIPGWKESLGANVEAFVAFVCGKTTMMIDNLSMSDGEATFDIVSIDLTDYRLPYMKSGGRQFDPHNCPLDGFESHEQQERSH